ncbi:MAG TPA: adenylate/guanylate cyclase domain-containing protein [Actinomycetes bacterium]
MTTTAAAAHRPSLRPYVPDLLDAWRPTHDDERHMQVDGSLAFVDISGFTKLTERLARRGKVGAEEMSDLLDATFAGLLEHARAEGGDLVKWGGDAVLLLFRGAEHASRACRSAYDMRATLRDIGTLRTSSGTVTLRMSVGIHSGSFDFYLVGDPDRHRELLVAGPQTSTTAVMESIATAGQIVVSGATAHLLPHGAHRPGSGEGAHLLRSRPPSRAMLLPEQRRQPTDEDLVGYLPVALREQLLADGGEAEHRSVAVAFVKFSGTDELTATGGPAAVAEALDECVRVVQQATDEHDVTFFETDIDRDGGKIMLVAGAPRSTGHDEERMLRAVRAVMDRSVALRLRIGVNRGNVFAGDFGPAFRRTFSIKGDAVNLAARVMAKAGDGEVLATLPTLERSSTLFDTSPLEPFLVKGKALPVHAARVGAIVGQRTAQRPATSFVGRTEELAVLRDALDSAAIGDGRQVEVVGEPGIGKSRLVEELLAGTPDVQVLTGTGDEYESSTPYFPFRTLLRSALGLPRDARPAAVAAALRTAVQAVAPQLLPWLPLLAIPLDLGLDPTRETSELDEQFRRQRLEEVVDDLLARLLTRPTVMLIEDAHLLDDASADLVHRLSRDISRRPWLLLVTRRELADGYVPRHDGHVTTLRPAALEPDEALDLVRSATSDQPMTHEAMSALLVRSGGNPMFLEALVQAAGRSGSVNDLPESVEELVTSQIDRLSPRDRTVLRYAAVLGIVGDLAILRALLADTHEVFDLDQRLPVLGDFMARESSGRFGFRHALFRDVAYEGLPFRRRQVLHDQVGTTIEASVPDPTAVSELLSLHFFQAGRYDKAWSYSRKAGERARAKFANGEAVDFFQRAVESAKRAGTVLPLDLSSALESLGDARALAGMSSAAVEAFRQARRQAKDDPVREAELLFKEARIYQRLGKVPQSLRILHRAMTGLEGVDGSAAHVSRSHLATRYSWGRMTQGKYQQALHWATVAAREAEDSADKSALAHAYTGLHLARHYAGQPEEIPYGRLALLAYEELGDLAGQGHSANNLGVEALDRGQLTEAFEYFERASRTFARIGDEADQANATYNQADVLILQGRLSEAETLLARALSIARAVEDEELVALVLRETGRVHVGLGRPGVARRHLADARERFTALGLTQELAAVDAAEADCQRLEHSEAGAGDAGTSSDAQA